MRLFHSVPVSAGPSPLKLGHRGGWGGTAQEPLDPLNSRVGRWKRKGFREGSVIISLNFEYFFQEELRGEGTIFHYTITHYFSNTSCVPVVYIQCLLEI